MKGCSVDEPSHFDRRLTFFGGKGGVGKTTCAASFALLLCERGHRTLVVSTDAAHSLGDIFRQRIGHRPRRLRENLWGLEIDPERESRRYMQRVRDQLGASFSSVIVDEIRRQIDAAYLSPGAEETAIFDKFIDLMEEERGEFDRIVFDTAPTGHTLRLLTLPELLGAWIDRLIEKRRRALSLLSRTPDSSKPPPQSDPILKLLRARKERFAFARECLLDRQMTAFVFVMEAERLSIAETRRAADLLRKHGIAVAGVVVNRIMPDSPDPFHRKRRKLQQERMETIRHEFGDQFLGALPLLEREVDDEESLQAIANALKELCASQAPFGGRD